MEKVLVKKWNVDIPVEKVQAAILNIMKTCGFDKKAHKPARAGKDVCYYPARTNNPDDCDAIDTYISLVIRKITNSKTCIILTYEKSALESPNLSDEEFAAIAAVAKVINIGATEETHGNWRLPHYERIYQLTLSKIEDYVSSL